jgi:DNA-directed RNA polymerase subunit M/transcription elongation factor TFIIS
MAELRRANCRRCGYRSDLISFGGMRRETYNGWPALDKQTNQVVEVDLDTLIANKAQVLYYYNGEASRKFSWINKQLFQIREEAYKHKCPRCGSFHLIFHLEALAD